jgi:AcrR family transcriptional regulator
MSSTTDTPARYNTPLRQAQRDLTRSRIKNAARNLFYEKHYDTTTMEEIAEAAGLRRSTLYLHYKDKAEILVDIIVDYTPRAKEVLATLPGPRPSLDAVQTWVKRVAKFVAKERAPLSILQETRARNRGDAEFEAVIGELLSALGTNNPRFAQAARPEAVAPLRARALMLLQELTYACGVFVEDTRDEQGKALLAVAAEDFHAFLCA